MKHKAAAPGPLYHNFLLMALAGGSILIALLALLVSMSWRSAQRLEPLDRNLTQFERLEEQFSALIEPLARGSPRGPRRPSAEGGRVTRSVAQHGDDLPGVAHELGRDGTEPYARAIERLGASFADEVAAQRGLLEAVARDNARELQTALAAAVIVPLLAVAYWLLYRRHVLQPLDKLGSAIALLARKDFRPIDFGHVDPAIRPLFDQYTRVVGRMRDLEAAHVKREEVLRGGLEQATRALFRQQTLLARADRLAVSGDLAARVAHRLRSPLSGVMLAMTNLRDESDSSTQRERLSQAIDALQRGLDDLSGLVAEVQRTREPRGPVQLRHLVDELLLLVRYKSENRGFVVENQVPPDLVCNLPETDTRHALMSLLNNAAEAQEGVDQKYIGVLADDLGDEVRIAIRDRGPGFTQPELEAGNGREPWTRDGAGLGLAIVRRFVDYLGGRLVLENLEDRGAQAVLYIPREVPGG